MSKYTIHVVSQPNCGKCSELKESLSSKGIIYVEHDLSAERSKLLPSLRSWKVSTTPVIYIQDEDGWICKFYEYTKTGIPDLTPYLGS